MDKLDRDVFKFAHESMRANISRSIIKQCGEWLRKHHDDQPEQIGMPKPTRGPVLLRERDPGTSPDWLPFCADGPMEIDPTAPKVHPIKISIDKISADVPSDPCLPSGENRAALIRELSEYGAMFEDSPDEEE